MPETFSSLTNAYRIARSKENAPTFWQLAPTLLIPLWSEGQSVRPAGTPLARFAVRTQVSGDRREALWLPAGSKLDVEAALELGDKLRFAVGLPDLIEEPTDGADPAESIDVDEELSFDVEFQLIWTPFDGDPVTLDSHFLSMAPPAEGDRKEPWVEREVVVTKELVGTGALTWQTLGRWPVPAAIGEPRLVRAGAKADPRLNLILYVIDTLRPDHLSCYGARNPTSPRIDALADEGFRFENFYAVAPWTRPTTATVLTGFYPSWHGMGFELPLPLSFETMAETLAKNGYSTWAAVANPQVGGASLQFSQGFGRFVDHTAIGNASDGPAPATSRQLNSTALPWLAANGDEPFFLYLHSLDPHTPYAPPSVATSPFGRDYRGPMYRSSMRRKHLLESADQIGPVDLRYIEDVYDNEILYQDRQIGVLVDHLREHELLDETAIVILSDHGEEFRDHGDWNHGYRMWEEQLRVPLILWIPESERERRGVHPRVITELVSQVDLLPGILDFLGAKDDFPRQGSSWLPLVSGNPAELLPLFAEDFQTWDGDSIGSFRQDNYKLIWTRFDADQRDEVKLFDLALDPSEQEDLAASKPELVRELEEARDALVRYTSRVRDRLDEAGFGNVEPAQADSEPAALTESEVRELEALGYLQGHDD